MVLCSFMEITNVKAHKVFDSQGYQTIEVEVTVQDGTVLHASAPHGSTKGSFELQTMQTPRGVGLSPELGMVERRYNCEIAPQLRGMNAEDFVSNDKLLKEICERTIVDARCMVATSYALLKASEYVRCRPMFRILGEFEQNAETSFTIPMFNMIDGNKCPLKFC